MLQQHVENIRHTLMISFAWKLASWKHSDFGRMDWDDNWTETVILGDNLAAMSAFSQCRARDFRCWYGFDERVRCDCVVTSR